MTPATCQLVPTPLISLPTRSPSTTPLPSGLTVLRATTVVLEWCSPSTVTRPADATSPRSRALPRLSTVPPPAIPPPLTMALPMVTLTVVTVRCPTLSEVVWLLPLLRPWLERCCRSKDFDSLTFRRWIPPAKRSLHCSG